MNNDFIKYLESKNHSNSTQSRYADVVNKFTVWFGQDAALCTKKDVLKYLEHLQNKGNSNKTRSSVLTALNHYFTFLHKTEVITSNPTSLIKLRGVKRKTLHHIYTDEERNKLFDDYYHSFIRGYDDSHLQNNPYNIKNNFLIRSRNYIMLSLFLYQGLVAGELCKITLDDVNLNNATIKITGSKRSNGRTIPLQAAQIGSIINYINNIRPQYLELNSSNSNNFFISLSESTTTKPGTKHLTHSLQLLTKQIKELDKNFDSFKQIRASVITHWLKTEGLRKAQYLAGHRYISSTENYLRGNLEGLKDDIAKFNPF